MPLSAELATQAQANKALQDSGCYEKLRALGLEFEINADGVIRPITLDNSLRIHCNKVSDSDKNEHYFEIVAYFGVNPLDKSFESKRSQFIDKMKQICGLDLTNSTSATYGFRRKYDEVENWCRIWELKITAEGTLIDPFEENLWEFLSSYKNDQPLPENQAVKTHMANLIFATSDNILDKRLEYLRGVMPESKIVRHYSIRNEIAKKLAPYKNNPNLNLTSGEVNNIVRAIPPVIAADPNIHETFEKIFGFTKKIKEAETNAERQAIFGELCVLLRSQNNNIELNQIARRELRQWEDIRRYPQLNPFLDQASQLSATERQDLASKRSRIQ